ncbi:MAG: hypothetical protein DRN14_02640 [Thermoplasmata archaeon]|nr:MAG: hypothetical protein DRN14_02640 [Thermoplasmata archaeon]
MDVERRFREYIKEMAEANERMNKFVGTIDRLIQEAKAKLEELSKQKIKTKQLEQDIEQLKQEMAKIQDNLKTFSDGIASKIVRMDKMIKDIQLKNESDMNNVFKLMEQDKKELQEAIKVNFNALDNKLSDVATEVYKKINNLEAVAKKVEKHEKIVNKAREFVKALLTYSHD